MRAGELRQRVAIQTRTKSQNSIGEWVDTWSTFATVWAAIEPLTGNKYVAAKQANSEISGVVRIRYRANLTTSMRLLFGSRVLQIIDIIPVKELRNETHIHYKEVLD